MPGDGISFEGLELPHPSDLDRSARVSAEIMHPGLEESDPEAFARAVARARQGLAILEGEVVDYKEK